MFSTPRHESINILPPCNIKWYGILSQSATCLLCTPTPLGKVASPTFHGLISNNSSHSTKPWVGALLLSSC